MKEIKIKYLRNKYFDACVEIENKIIDIKKYLLFDTYISQWRIGKYFDFEQKYIKYIENHILRYEESSVQKKFTRKRISEALSVLNENCYVYFLDGFLYDVFNKAFNHLKDDLKWTNRNGINVITSGQIEVFNDQKLQSKKMLDYLNDIGLTKRFKGGFSNFEIAELKLSPKLFEHYNKLRNQIAHSKGDDILKDDKLINFVNNDFDKFIQTIFLIHNRIADYDREKNTKRFPKY